MVGHPYGTASAAAGPALRAALGGGDHCAPGPHCWRDRLVEVCGSSCAWVRLYDWCACGGDHVIDLYHNVFVAVAEKREVTISW